MLHVKNETLFKPKKNEKRREFLPRLQKKIKLSSTFFLQPSVAFQLDINPNFVLYRMQVILGR